MLAQAHALVEERPEVRWPWRLSVNLYYGYTLLSLGRNADALNVLEQARAADARLRSERVEPFYGYLQMHDDALGKELFKSFRLQLAGAISQSLLATPQLMGDELFRRFKQQGAIAQAMLGTPQVHTISDLIAESNVNTAEIPLMLARAYVACGKPESVAQLYQDSTAGVRLPSSADANARLAAEHRFFQFGVLLARAGQRQLADEAFHKALNLGFERQQGMVARVPSYHAQLAGFSLSRDMMAVRLGFRLSGPDSRILPANVSEEIVALVIQNKGLGLRYAERANLLLETSSDSETAQVRQCLREIDDQMMALEPTNSGLANLFKLTMQQGFAMQQAMPELRARGLGDIIVPGSTLLPQVRTALNGDVAIGYAQYVTGLTEGNGSLTSKRYLRYCISNTIIEVRDVGACDHIDRAVFAMRRAILANSDWTEQGRFLAQHLLGELPATVERNTQWVIDPDGPITLVPFEVLPDNKGQLQLLHRSIRYVTSLAQLTIKRASKVATARACIVANPTYAPPSGNISDNGAPSDGWRLSAGIFARSEIDVPPLPETADEAHAVQGSLARIGIASTSFERADATRDALLNLRSSPPVLHVASHAVILDNKALADASDTEHDPLSEAVFDMLFPGRRAALVLAGTAGPEVLFANDIAQLSLDQTQLAVLSGCDTGNGDIDIGEGVASLRRALESAGAAGTVTSLWPVPSHATVELMATFYNALSRGLKKGEALRLAKLSLRETGHPVSAWAGFLLAGDDTPLRVDAIPNGIAR
ncbi:CHAT domain-containing protein [Paraburkholderia sp. RL17-337-BIB-A]|uniref:CHAT domain-containing protein n=1 Tax=Paraburkholderia sp. RL17-337-BIB-A TaxID=3031636 RepID=UPI0038B8C125